VKNLKKRKKASSVTLPKLKAKCQELCNEYIRLRDEGQPCISCGQIKPLQAGHFFAVKGYDSLRFNEDNVHGECASCNCFNESHLIGYYDNLLIKIGVERMGKLKMLAEDYKQNGYKWSRTELLEKIEYFKEKIKELKWKQQDNHRQISEKGKDRRKS